MAVILLLMAAGAFIFRGYKGNERYYNGGALVEKELLLYENEQIFYLYIAGALFLLVLLLLAFRYYGKSFQKHTDGDLSVKV